MAERSCSVATARFAMVFGRNIRNAARAMLSKSKEVAEKTWHLRLLRGEVGNLLGFRRYAGVSRQTSISTRE